MDSKLVISCRMMHNLIKIHHVVQEFMSCEGMHGQKDSHRDNSAHLRVVEFFCHCVAHQDVFNTHLLLIKHKK